MVLSLLKLSSKNVKPLVIFLVFAVFPPPRWSDKNKNCYDISKKALPKPSSVFNYSQSQFQSNTLHRYFNINTCRYKCNTCYITNCSTCPYILSTSYFSVTSYGVTKVLNYYSNCGSNNLIYLITCNKCNLQYIGETGCSLRERFTNHCSTIKLNYKNKKSPIGIHFNSIGHNISHLKVTPIEIISSNSVPWRRAWEVFWQLSLDTLFPLGLNKFPVHIEHWFHNLEIKEATDLAMFLNLVCLELKNNSPLSPSSPLPLTIYIFILSLKLLYICMCIYVCMYMPIYVCVCVCMYVCMFVCLYVYVCVCVCMFVYNYVFRHIYF